jgi:ferredoxin
MILTQPKSWQEIKTAIDQWGLHKVVVVSCGSCSAQCKTGGTEGLEKIVASLTAEGISIVDSIIIEEPCDLRSVKHDLRLLGEAVQKTDGFIVASCGLGAQTIAEVTKKPTIITTNTIMMSQTERIGIYHEKCKACGQCVLNETAGICPISACAKSLLNGPCGGSIDGMCEVGNYTRPCAWVEIYQRLKQFEKLNLFSIVRPPRDWHLATQKETVNVQQEMKSYYACNED